MSSAWFEKAAPSFLDHLSSIRDHQVFVLYNADVDGFVASYFIHRAVPSDVRLKSRAVWNYEFDFAWLLPMFSSAPTSNLICVDIPIIQEPEVLHVLTQRHSILIYDHHVVPARSGINLEGVFYFNSRLYSGEESSQPASAFAAGIAAQAVRLRQNDFGILALGLIGDHSLGMYPDLVENLRKFSKEPIDPLNPWNSWLGRWSSKINAAFRAHPSVQPERMEETLIHAADNGSLSETLERFSEQFSLDDAVHLVDADVKRGLKIFESHSRVSLICRVLDLSTFSVGIVASLLATNGFATVICLGFRTGSRIQFELRRADSTHVDLTQLLTRQRKYFTPITSGGHPVAAGALINASDEESFCTSLRRAFLELEGEPHGPDSRRDSP